MKENLQKKFYTLIVTALLFNSSASAQIVYTDVIPDSTMLDNIPIGLNTKNYNLDLDNNANDDFILTAYYGPSILGGTPSTVYASPLNGNALKDTFTTGNVPIPLQLNAVIDSNLLLQQSWQTSGSHTLRESGGIGPVGLWNNLSDYYLGLRLLQSGQTYYGWVRLRVNVTSSYASVIVRDYAYNTIPNQPILAGQTVATGISPLSFGEGLGVRLFPNPANNHLTIALPINNKKVDVTIADITGKVIYKTIASDTQIVEVNTQDFAVGIYVVHIQATDFTATRKFIVEK